MVTAARAIASPQQRERDFFLMMALAIAAAIVGGFGIRILLGVTSFDAPWWVHVHGVSFMAWIAFYVIQNALVARGDLRSHRTLGIAGAIAAAWIFFVGIALTTRVFSLGSTPPFFPPTYFLAQNWMFATCFLSLTYAAIALRSKPDWHRRLMLCATLVISIPGFARWIILLDPPPSIVKHLVAVSIFLVPALAFDVITRGRVHSAYLWGIASILLMYALATLLSAFPPFQGLADSLAPSAVAALLTPSAGEST